ncbi:MAG: MFS transporter [Anaerolineaceae bacterium]|nr:MFS transporter [Anaerolineaceae bacterium]
MQFEEKENAQPTQSELSIDRRNFIAGLWHGAFLAFGMALTDPTTVISAFVSNLTGSTVWVGGLSTVLTVAGALPQLFVARWLEPKPRKLPYLLAAISLRVISWGTLAWLIFSIGTQHPIMLAWIFVGMLVIFYAGGGLANIPYTDIIGKVIPQERRGAFFGGKGALAGPLSVGAALLTRQILANVHYPNNYALLFGLAAFGLAIASLGFWAIREPLSSAVNNKMLPWNEYWHQLLNASQQMKELIGAQLLTGFSLMALPFYVVFALKQLQAPAGAVGWFLLVQVIGGTLSNLMWARLVDHSGSRRMLFFCAITSTLTPILAVVLSPMGWIALLPVFFLAGAITNGRNVGFQSALLEIAPVAERSTYAGLNAVLTLPIAFLSLAAGLFLQHWSYPALFLLVAAFVGAGAIAIDRWANRR